MAGSSDAEPLAKRTRVDAAGRRYVKVRHKQAIPCYIEDDWVVGDLLEVVKAKYLLNVPSGKLKLFQTEKAKIDGTEAFDPGDSVASIEGGKTSEEPLFVNFPEVPVGGASGSVSGGVRRLLPDSSESKPLTRIIGNDKNIPNEIDAGRLKEFVLVGTQIPEKGLFVRKSLKDLYKTFMEELQVFKMETNLYGLIGSPGTGKTLCGLLVAHDLVAAGVKCLYIHKRGSVVLATTNFVAEPNVLEGATADDTAQAIREFIDADDKSVVVVDIAATDNAGCFYEGVRGVANFARYRGKQVNLFLIGSAYGPRVILGKGQETTRSSVVRFMPGWSKEECLLCLKREPMIDADDVFRICGGCARFYSWTIPKVRTVIRGHVKALTQSAVEELLALCPPETDVASNLMCCYSAQHDSGRDPYHQQHMIMAPLSKFAVTQLVEREDFGVDDAYRLWNRLRWCRLWSAAGHAFELMCHCFFVDIIRQESQAEIRVKMSDGEEEERVTVNGIDLKLKVLEDFNGEPQTSDYIPDGYYKPKDTHYIALDAVLVVRSEIYALQFTTAEQHEHRALKELNKLVRGRKTKLLLWCPPGHTCEWTPKKASEGEQWELGNATCETFVAKFGCRLG